MVPSRYLWIVVLLLVGIPKGGEGGANNYERKIREMLFDNQQAIEAHTRPVKSRNNTVYVQMQVYLKHLLELDQTNETLSAQIILRLEWYDNRLTWNSAQYGDVKEIYVTRDLIWIPDMTIYNELQEIGDVFDDTLLMVHSSGKVVWTSSIPTLTPCAVDLSYYPFDEHVCHIRIGSWTYHGFHLAIELKYADPLQEMNERMPMTSRATLQGHNIWEVTNSTVVVENRFYSCCVEPYPSAVLYITIARKSPQYLMTLILPTCLSILIMFKIFFFPPSFGEKIGLGCFAFLYLLILDIHASTTIPRNGSGIPNIVILIGSSLILAGIMLIVSVVTVNLSRTRHQGGIPLIVKNILSSFLRKVLCLNYQNPGLSDAATSMVETELWRHDKVEKQHEWLILAKAIDRIFLILYLVIMLILLATLLRISKVPAHSIFPMNGTQQM